VRILVIALVTLALAGCGGGGEATLTEPDVGDESAYLPEPDTPETPFQAGWFCTWNYTSDGAVAVVAAEACGSEALRYYGAGAEEFQEYQYGAQGAATCLMTKGLRDCPMLPEEDR
jgi:hypothetical protein